VITVVRIVRSHGSIAIRVRRGHAAPAGVLNAGRVEPGSIDRRDRLVIGVVGRGGAGSFSIYADHCLTCYVVHRRAATAGGIDRCRDASDIVVDRRGPASQYFNRRNTSPCHVVDR
jgi:hypothetical protein